MTMLSCLVVKGGESTAPGLRVLRLLGGDGFGLLEGLTEPLLSDLGEGGLKSKHIIFLGVLYF